MTGIQNSRFPNSDLTLLGLGLRLTPGLQEPYSYRAVERYDSLNTVAHTNANCCQSSVQLLNIFSVWYKYRSCHAVNPMKYR